MSHIKLQLRRIQRPGQLKNWAKKMKSAAEQQVCKATEATMLAAKAAMKVSAKTSQLA